MTATVVGPAGVDRVPAPSGPLLDPVLVDDVLLRLGFPDRPRVTMATLTQLYRAWCEHMPYDNGRIREGLWAAPEGPVVSATADQLLRENLRSGRSGQCTETADALYCLLRDLGFDTHLCLAYYGSGRREGLEVNHISVLTRIDEVFVVTDTVLLSGIPITLEEQRALCPPLQYDVSQDLLGTWRIDSVTPVARAPLAARFFYLTHDRSVCTRIFDQIQTDGFADFNGNYYGRRALDGGMTTLSTSTADRSTLTLHRTTVDGTVSRDCRTVEERRAAMVEGLGFSAEYAAALPPDTPPA